MYSYFLVMETGNQPTKQTMEFVSLRSAEKVAGTVIKRTIVGQQSSVN